MPLAVVFIALIAIKYIALIYSENDDKNSSRG